MTKDIIDCDPSKKTVKPIQFKFKETGARIVSMNLCPFCRSGYIHHTRRQRKKISFGKYEDIKSHWHCSSCKKDFDKPYVTTKERKSEGNLPPSFIKHVMQPRINPSDRSDEKA
jgi:transposase-like protein